MTDQEIYQLIFSPGFSTNSQISEYSGRGVGLDVVVKKIEAIGGSVMVDSEEDKGTTVTLKIPLTLAIVEGMKILSGTTGILFRLQPFKNRLRRRRMNEFVIRRKSNDPRSRQTISYNPAP